VHSHGVNQRIEAYFEAASYQDALLSPKATMIGFLYFKLPEETRDAKAFTVDVEVSGDRNGKKIDYKLDLPPQTFE
jgi:hypothetical protein